MYKFGFLGTSREFLRLLDSLSTAAREGWAALEAAVATKEQTWVPEELRGAEDRGPHQALNYRATVTISLFCALFSVFPCSSDWENETEEAR